MSYQTSSRQKDSTSYLLVRRHKGEKDWTVLWDNEDSLKEIERRAKEERTYYPDKKLTRIEIWFDVVATHKLKKI